MTLEELAEAIGEEAAARLVRELGGCRFQVPRWREDGGGKWQQQIAAAIGERAARRFCAIYAGEAVEIPSRETLERRRRREEALRLAAQGVGANEIARRIGVSNRQARAWIAEARRG